MSNNSQWKMFQPPESHSSPLHDILELQPSNMQAKQAYRNGTYSGEYPSSGRDSSNYSNGLKSGNGSRFTVGTFSMDNCPMGDSTYSSSSTTNSSQYDSMTHPPIRETGIIEKLLHSYGFIQCCERQARLFFHFSQFSGNTEHLKIGDPVEFEMTYDRRTGKPIASTVTKIAPEVVLSEARVTGTVTTEVKGEGSGDNTGRISYENRGECFFLPYTKDDVEGNVVLHTGDAVSFQIATNQRGTLGACHVRFENPQSPVKYHGVVCSMKENFGFIERADVVKEIFFHFSEAQKSELALGDDVEFIIQTRNGKEVACNITKLPCGSVVFEDVSPEIMRGQVLKPLERVSARVQPTDPLPGRIRYRAVDHSEVEVPFGDKDQCGEFTLRHGDWVQFQVATDRRDQLKRATNISLLDESFNVSGERREQGVVCSLRPMDGFGYIKCVEREQTMSFRFTEVLRLGRELSVGDEVEFTVEPVSTFNMNNRQSAIRIKHLPTGTVKFETLVERAVRGVISKEATLLNGNNSPTQASTAEYNGLITCQINQAKKTLPYRAKKSSDAKQPRVGDKVTFDIYQIKRTKELIAMSVILHQQNGIITNGIRDNIGRDNGSRDIRDIRDISTRDITTRDINRDINRDISTRDISTRDINRDISTREMSRDISNRDISRDITTREITRDISTRDISREISNRDINREITTRDISTRDIGRDISTRDVGRDISTRDVGRDITTRDISTRDNNRDNGGRAVQQGFIAALKDGFGFIETSDHNKEVFFHFSNFEGNPDHLELGSEVGYTLGRSGGGGGCASAEFVRTLPKGTIPLAKPLEPSVNGTVTRTLRALNPDQTHYSGLIQVEGGVSYEYGIMGLACKREILQVGDPVTFQVDNERRATNIVPIRKKRRATVDAIKGGFGFLSLEMEESRRLFFHMSEVRGSPAELQPGDCVEFVMLTNPRNGKSSACNVVKIAKSALKSRAERPERLLARLRTVSLDEAAGPRVVVARTPRGPDGTRGFRPRRPLAEVLGE